MFRPHIRGFILLLTALISVSAYAETPKPAASTSAEPSALPSSVPSDSADPLRAAVINSQAQLGALDPAQKRIFDQEVVPQYPLFIRDYKRVGSSVSVELDLTGIRNTIRFSAQKTLGQPDPKILLFLEADPNCPKCQEDAQAIKRHMQLRVERRGFTAVWVSPEELAGATISDLVGPRGTFGYMKMSLIPAPQDDVDSAHADEARFQAKLELAVRSVSTYQDQAELFDTGSFENESEKLLTHAFSELGAKSDLAGVSSVSKDDLMIQLTGISGFAQYSRIRNAIQTRLKGVALVEERKISRGQAVFAVKTKKTQAELKALLDGVTGGANSAVQMEIHP
jgi:hypothetical protein